MSDKRNPDSEDESEFGLGTGLIDSGLRADREALNWEGSHFEGWEIAALPKTFDGSMPDRPKQEETPVPRLLPDEEESDRG